jgi:hypothetical protein
MARIQRIRTAIDRSRRRSLLDRIRTNGKTTAAVDPDGLLVPPDPGLAVQPAGLELDEDVDVGVGVGVEVGVTASVSLT